MLTVASSIHAGIRLPTADRSFGQEDGDATDRCWPVVVLTINPSVLEMPNAEIVAAFSSAIEAGNRMVLVSSFTFLTFRFCLEGVRRRYCFAQISIFSCDAGPYARRKVVV